jgi:hypothetical protein
MISYPAILDTDVAKTVVVTEGSNYANDIEGIEGDPPGFRHMEIEP